MAAFVAGQIVIVDWRDALPREPSKLRPALVVDDHTLFDQAYPNVILAPLTEDGRLAIGELSVRIEPTVENACNKTCFALSHCLATTSKVRVRGTESRITTAELTAIRAQIAVAVGVVWPVARPGGGRRPLPQVA